MWKNNRELFLNCVLHRLTQTEKRYIVVVSMKRSGIKYIKSFAGKLIFTISNNLRVRIFHYVPGSDVSIIFDQKYFSSMPHIEKVYLTNELPEGTLSPIIQFKDYAVRWSESVNFWVYNQEEIPSYFSRDGEYQTIADLEKALELDPNFVEALYAMGAAQKKIEDYHKALEYLNRAIELQPDFIHAKALQKLILTKYLKKL